MESVRYAIDRKLHNLEESRYRAVSLATSKAFCYQHWHKVRSPVYTSIERILERGRVNLEIILK